MFSEPPFHKTLRGIAALPKRLRLPVLEQLLHLRLCAIIPHLLDALRHEISGTEPLVCREEALDRLLIEAQFLGDAAIHAGVAAAPNVAGKARGAQRVLQQKLQPLRFTFPHRRQSIRRTSRFRKIR